MGAPPFILAINPAGTRVYVSINAGGTDNRVRVVDTTTNTVIATIVVGFSPGALAVNPSGTRLYVANGPASTLSVIDTSTNAVIATVPLIGSHASSGVVVDHSGSKVYAGGSDSQLIHVLDTATNTVLTEISVPGRPGALVLNPAGTRLYAGLAFNAQTVAVIDTSTNSVIAVIPIGVDAGGGIDITPDGARAYVALGPANRVAVIDAATNTLVNAIPVCCHPASYPTGFIGPRVPVEVAFLLMDEDNIDNGLTSIENISFKAPFCGAGSPAMCVNDDIANPGVRELLFTRGNDITPQSGLVLTTGQVGDAGLFRLTKPDPQISLQNGATFAAAEFIAASGAAADENNLDKIDGLAPLSQADILALQGKIACAVVYDSDISVDRSAGFGNLKGATLGLTAFRVTAAIPRPARSSNLPRITVELLPSSQVRSTCQRAVP